MHLMSGGGWGSYRHVFVQMLSFLQWHNSLPATWQRLCARHIAALVALDACVAPVSRGISSGCMAVVTVVQGGMQQQANDAPEQPAVCIPATCCGVSGITALINCVVLCCVVWHAAG
jgi:hypothetical protein